MRVGSFLPEGPGLSERIEVKNNDFTITHSKYVEKRRSGGGKGGIALTWADGRFSILRFP
jgi:hypothetical protein